MQSNRLWTQLTHGKAAQPFWALRTQRMLYTCVRFVPTAATWGGVAALGVYFAFRPNIPETYDTLLKDIGLRKIE
eukprot:CAMPEP_0114615408 /NCGR_PEP_ID=MMETSP0168-20121206/6149_1 /TAXON_ID=95228 ORGANISM="Vannella sp., Strain DIVA3 517/6/12" /NCGR_SAMPLE_ID=MMETSP0168 /ASSEMBLY_ACC=CAM_ASM_000044 /LENGTH=74 /DNA_ID=CAMNT_0001826477 /DNA_START=36 /DNA_END=260 /DNA_ORIENTATION=-